jgi:hypothetical protein
MMAGIVRCFNRVGLYYKAFKRMPFLQWPQRDSYQLYFFQKKSKLLTTGELGLSYLEKVFRQMLCTSMATAKTATTVFAPASMIVPLLLSQGDAIP